MKFTVTIKSVYGKDTIYPVCAKSVAFLKALGLKTFTPSAIEAAKVCGVEFEQVTEQKAI